MSEKDANLSKKFIDQITPKTLFKKNKISSKQRINWNSWSQSSAMLIDAILEKSKRNV